MQRLQRRKRSKKTSFKIEPAWAWLSTIRFTLVTRYGISALYNRWTRRNKDRGGRQEVDRYVGTGVGRKEGRICAQPPPERHIWACSLQLFPSAHSKPRACYAKLEACNARCRILAHTWPGPSEPLTLEPLATYETGLWSLFRFHRPFDPDVTSDERPDFAWLFVRAFRDYFLSVSCFLYRIVIGRDCCFEAIAREAPESTVTKDVSRSVIRILSTPKGETELNPVQRTKKNKRRMWHRQQDNCTLLSLAIWNLVGDYYYYVRGFPLLHMSNFITARDVVRGTRYTERK